MDNYCVYNLLNIFLISHIDSHDYVLKYCELNNIECTYDTFDIIDSTDDTDGYSFIFDMKECEIMRRVFMKIKNEELQEKPITLLLRDIKDNIGCIEKLYYTSVLKDIDLRVVNNNIDETEYIPSNIPEFDTLLKFSYKEDDTNLRYHELGEILNESQVFNIGISNNNLVISGTKIASTWTSSLTYNYIRNNINSDVNEVECRDMGTLPISNGYTPFENSIKNKYQEDVLKIYYDILNNKSDGKLFILIRNPIIRYIQSLKQDLFTYVNTRNSVHDTISKLLADEDTHTIEPYFIENNIHTIQGFVSHNIKNTKILNNLFKNLFKLIFNTNSSDTNWYSGGIRTSHYTTYYGPLLTLVNGIDSKYISILDIDDDNISSKILSNNHNLKYNKTSKLIKSIFVNNFLKEIQDNPDILLEITTLISSDIGIYKFLKNK